MASSTTPYAPSGRKATNLTISVAVIEEGKALGINASRAAEEGIKAAIKKAKEEQWLEENKEAIEAHNKYVEENGIPLTPAFMQMKPDGSI